MGRKKEVYTKDNKDFFVNVAYFKEKGYSVEATAYATGYMKTRIKLCRAAINYIGTTYDELKNDYETVWPKMEKYFQLISRRDKVYRSRTNVYKHKCQYKSTGEDIYQAKRDIGDKERQKRLYETHFKPGDLCNGFMFLKEYPYFNLWKNTQKGFTECFFKNERPIVHKEER